MDGNDIAFTLQQVSEMQKNDDIYKDSCILKAAERICSEISLLRKQIEKLDRTIEKLNEPPDIRIS